MSQVTQGGSYEAVYQSGVTGLVGTVAMRVDDNEGNTVFGPTTAGIVELGNMGFYVKTITAPGVAGEQFSIIWSQDGSFDADTNFGEDLFITDDDVLNWPSLLPIDGTMGGPCRAWTTEAAVLDCCGQDTDTSVLIGPILAASQTLYALSGKKYSGSCEQRVRPCSNVSCYGPWGPWGLGAGGWGWWGEGQRSCGCRALSRVPLAGHATRVTEVTIDGLIVDASEYRLDEHRFLTRLPDGDGDRQFWPGCQDLTLDEDQPGTFSVVYEYGIDPPVSGQLAATELACAIHQTCPGGGEPVAPEDCLLPNGVTKIERQGLTISLEAFVGWGRNPNGIWATGLPLTDMFLNAVNPTGRRKRRSTVWSPDIARMPRTVGQPTGS
jgi:hypothetical protein